MARVISASLLPRPSPKRIEAAASTRLRPKAASTWEGDPWLQAEPLLTASRWRSSRCRRVPSTPCTVTFRLWASRGAPAPLSSTPLSSMPPRSRRPSQSWSRRPPSRPARSSRSASARSSASPSPTTRGTGRVPARRPSCWLPPWSWAASLSPGRTSRAPTPLGP